MTMNWRIAIALSLAVVVSGCELATVLPPNVPPGGRIIVVTVDNRSQVATVLIVGAWSENDKANGFDRPLQAVGAAQPASVPPGAKIDVRLGVPAGTDWAVFVNPGPKRGLLFTSGEAPSDTVPFKVVVAPDGEPFMRSPDDPVWFPEQPDGSAGGA